jgi:hypothetical protein
MTALLPRTALRTGAGLCIFTCAASRYDCVCMALVRPRPGQRCSLLSARPEQIRPQHGFVALSIVMSLVDQGLPAPNAGCSVAAAPDKTPGPAATASGGTLCRALDVLVAVSAATEMPATGASLPPAAATVTARTAAAKKEDRVTKS